MATVRLPDDPSFEQLRKRAKDLRDQARDGAPDALQLIGAHHPGGPHAPSLAGAQLVVARHYGFASWAALKRHVQIIERHRRVPDQIDAAGTVADEFLLLACLRYGNDDVPSRWQRAAELLAAHPELTRTSVHAAAATADLDALAALLAGDPASARADGGPFGWEPILYLCYARHDPGISEDMTCRAAALLLEHGADPNAGYLWHGLTSPFTALTGAFGGGEGDQPPHPHAVALARVLLAAGADPNDAQALYNRQFRTDDSHLALLLEHGLGRGDGGPWRAWLGAAVPSPAGLIADQLWWAVAHDMAARVRLLAEYGADIHGQFPVSNRPARQGVTPVQLAVSCGCRSVVDYLVAQGVPRPAYEGVDGLIAAALAGDRVTVDRLRHHVLDARRQRPGLIVWAAARRAWDAVPLLVELGFDVNARGRGDIPHDQGWQTALHEAASRDDLDGARLLIDLGADPNIRDARFGATPLDWAEHFHHTTMAEFLRPLGDRHSE